MIKSRLFDLYYIIVRLINSNFKTLKISHKINIFKISKIIVLKIINEHIYLIESILFQQI